MLQVRVERADPALVRLRAVFGLLLFPFALYAFSQSGWLSQAIGDTGEELWDLFCLGVACAGLFGRALEAGFHGGKAPEAPSGLYAMVRYPLFTANALIVVGLVLLLKSAWFTILVLSALAFYYRRRVALADKLFVAERGETAWMRFRQVSAFFPTPIGERVSFARFSWTNFLSREAGPIALVGLLFFISECLEGTVIEQHALQFWVQHEPHWLAFMLASSSLLLFSLFTQKQLAGAISLPAGGAVWGSRPFTATISDVMEWLSATHVRAVSTLVLFSLLLLLQGFASLSVTSRDESRFAQPSKQMVETGDYIDIRLQEAARYRKPIGIYWLQAGTVKAAEALGVENARNRIEIYRLVSLIAAIGSVLLTYWIALAFVARRNAVLAAAALAASSLLGVEARIATIDAAQLLTSTAAFGALAYVYLNRDYAVSNRQAWSWVAIFWTGIGASLLLKGPIILGIVGLTLATLIVRERSIRWLLRLKPLAGVLWTLVMVAPWYLAIYLQTKGAFFERSVSGDLMSRLLQPAEGHWGPPGYFWLLFWVSFWPAAMLAPQASVFAWAKRSDPRIFFLIAWIVPAWIMFELVVTKLPHYVLPLYPGIAILIACLIDRDESIDPRARWVGLLWPAFAIAIPVAVALFAFRFDGELRAEFYAATVFGVALAVFAVWALSRQKVELAFVAALLAALATSSALYIGFPSIKGFAVARELVSASRLAPCPLPRLASSGYAEPNLIFYGGTDTAFVSPAGAADFLQQDECRVAVVERRTLAEFEERAKALGLLTRKLAEVHGFDYSNWRHSTFDVLIRK